MLIGGRDNNLYVKLHLEMKITMFLITLCFALCDFTKNNMQSPDFIVNGKEEGIFMLRQCRNHQRQQHQF